MGDAEGARRMGRRRWARQRMAVAKSGVKSKGRERRKQTGGGPRRGRKRKPRAPLTEPTAVAQAFWRFWREAARPPFDTAPWTFCARQSERASP